MTLTGVVVLAPLAVLRGDDARAGLLLEYAGRALIQEGIRIPVDLALYSHYLERSRDTIDEPTAARNRERAAQMTISEAIADGLAVGDRTG